MKLVKGMRDILPPESTEWRNLNNSMLDYDMMRFVFIFFYSVFLRYALRKNSFKRTEKQEICKF